MKKNSFSIKYQELKKSIVAICPSISKTSDFPEIIGTGFIIRSDGIILTCKHIINSIKRLPKRKNAPQNEWPVVIFYFHFIPEVGMMTIPLEVKAAGVVKEWMKGKIHYGEKIPDVGFIRVATKDLPTIKVKKEANFQEGDEVFVSGFPMGTDVLRAPGWIQQFSPTLQKAIISAVLPMPCKNPHALLLDCVLESGSSGSAVFDADSGEVVGMVYSGVKEPHYLVDKYAKGVLIYETPTAHTFAIPSNYLNQIVDGLGSIKELQEHELEKVKSIKELIEEAEKEGRVTKIQPKTREGIAKKISAKDIEFPD